MNGHCAQPCNGRYVQREKRTDITPVEQMQVDQSSCVYCGKHSGGHSLFNHCGACTISRYGFEKCQKDRWPYHKELYMALQSGKMKRMQG